MAARIENCPLARAVDRIGDWRTLELLHETLNGVHDARRMGENLGVTAATLRERLDAAVAVGLIAPHRDGYRPTDLGRSLRPLILVLAAWGNRELEPGRRGLVLVDARTGQEVEPVVVDRRTGRRVDTDDHVFRAGPAAGPELRARYA
ncbi:hypothetical protein OIE67_15310 [Nonomuraea fuscirosea]|uniref:winged helix-turn-helix transcriptional regulator n=1 Tax=Nonomuraea fuscirosea TaxID=1291556 RepID=UPI002DD854DC|nr:hypothetical protein [Nonomuraea fuscirosea]WSA55920.1 hypothetical protein OIE67_15310 [Nonomuraea fuscirosea]